MKTVILIALSFLSCQYGFGQDTTFKLMQEVLVKGTIHPKGRFHVTEKTGSYTDPNTGRPVGSFRMIFSVDTVSRQLVNIVTVEKSRKEHVTIFYFNNKGMLAQAATGTKKGKSTRVDNMFTYTEEENRLNDHDLEAMSEGSEKYDLLRYARRYTLAYKSDTSRNNPHHSNLKGSKNQ